MKIRCLDKKDCFANADGYCICLTNNDFGEEDVRFIRQRRKPRQNAKKLRNN